MQTEESLHEQINVELLTLIGQQARRVPVPIVLAMMLIASFAIPHVSIVLLLLWLSFCFGVLILRAWYLPHAINQDNKHHAIKWVIVLSALSGIAHGSSFLFFPYFSVLEQAIQTMVLLGIAAGAVATTFGKPSIFIAYLIPCLVPISFMWAIKPHPDNQFAGYIVTILCLLFGAVLLSLAKDMFRSFSTAFIAQSRQKTLNEQLQKSLTSEASANRAKTQFLAAASHDLRQPLHTVSIFCAALEMQNKQESNNEIIQHMNSAVATLGKQLDALLDISKLDANIMQPEFKPVGVAALFNELEREFSIQAAEKNLHIHFSLDRPTTLTSDEVLLLRILQNLIGNAIKYSSSGNIKVSLLSEDGAILCVEDSGVGIPEEEQEKIFEEFYQLHNSERDNSKGLGLGLAIVRRLCNLLDIELSLKSNETEGSRFCLKFPAETVQLQAHTQPPEKPAVNKLNDLKILLVEDNHSVATATQTLLENMACHVRCADSLETAIGENQENWADIVLADLRLRNEETGITVINRLRLNCQTLPAILISGDTAPERLQHANDAGLTLLHKPVNSDTLTKTILEEIKASLSA